MPGSRKLSYKAARDSSSSGVQPASGSVTVYKGKQTIELPAYLAAKALETATPQEFQKQVSSGMIGAVTLLHRNTKDMAKLFKSSDKQAIAATDHHALVSLLITEVGTLLPPGTHLSPALLAASNKADESIRPVEDQATRAFLRHQKRQEALAAPNKD